MSSNVNFYRRCASSLPNKIKTIVLRECSLAPIMSGKAARSAAALCSGLMLGLMALHVGRAADAPLPNDVLTVAKIPRDDTHRVYVVDFDLPHIIDGRTYVYNGDTGKMLGMLSTGFAGQFTMSPSRKNGYVATTYYDRLFHGNRADVVDVYDMQTLGWQHEITIPTKHAEAAPYPGLIATSTDGKYLFVQNATPSQSITLVDLTQNKFIAELGAAGCWTVWPSPKQANKVSSVCGDGTILTLTFDPAGKILTRQRSAQIFDPATDPMFVQGADTGSKVVFITFDGVVHVVDISGDVAKAEPGWQVTPPADQAHHWRPGGYQMLAFHKKTGRLFVAMHKNGQEGSHKWPADEIWVIDLASHKILQRVPGMGVISLTVTQDDAAKLYGLTATGDLVTFNAGGRVSFATTVPHVAESGTELVTR